MAEGDYLAGGITTISASAPGAQASKEITVAGAAATDIVLLTPAEALPRVNPFGVHTLYAVAGSGKVTVYSSRNELPEDVSFQYAVFEGPTS